MRSILKKYHPVPSIVSGLFIFILCLLPGNSFPDVSWAAAIAPDKWVHAILYAVWAIVYVLGKGVTPKAHIFLVLLLMFLFGGAIELFQENLLPDRSGEWLDWAADGAGLLLGATFGFFCSQ